MLHIDVPMFILIKSNNRVIQLDYKKYLNMCKPLGQFRKGLKPQKNIFRASPI
jgi:hypothetical protein